MYTSTIIIIYYTSTVIEVYVYMYTIHTTYNDVSSNTLLIKGLVKFIRKLTEDKEEHIYSSTDTVLPLSNACGILPIKIERETW